MSFSKHVWDAEFGQSKAKQPEVDNVLSFDHPNAQHVNPRGFRPYIIGVNAAKDLIRSRLKIAPPSDTTSPGYMHYPQDRYVNFFAQLVSERSVRKRIGGKDVCLWE